MAFIKVVENHGNVSKSMREVGYTEKTAKNPKNLTDSKGWQELLDEFIPDSLLAERHKELLNKREVVQIGHGEGTEYELLDQPDTQAVKAGLDMGYKLKGKYEAEKHIVTFPTPILDVLQDNSDQEDNKAL